MDVVPVEEIDEKGREKAESRTNRMQTVPLLGPVDIVRLFQLDRTEGQALYPFPWNQIEPGKTLEVSREFNPASYLQGETEKDGSRLLESFVHLRSSSSVFFFIFAPIRLMFLPYFSFDHLSPTKSRSKTGYGKGF